MLKFSLSFLDKRLLQYLLKNLKLFQGFDEQLFYSMMKQMVCYNCIPDLKVLRKKIINLHFIAKLLNININFLPILNSK
jgi:hypothetical protein